MGDSAELALGDCHETLPADVRAAYDATADLDDLRQREYSRLDERGVAYLDYTGAGLFAASQVRAHTDLIAREVLGNPHSASLTSAASTALVEETRRSVLQYFNGTDAYTAIFTANASAALKLVGESYPFAPGGRLLLTADNHNSVNGIREFASAKGAAVEYSPLTTPELRLDRERLMALLDARDRSRPNLFAYPAQSNFSGVKHPLDLVAAAHERGWDVLLDAAAYVPTNRLDLQEVRPDFVVLSFYKMFGYPTGVGCLLVRRDAIGRLRRPWYAGGTVNFATIQGRMHMLAADEAGFEDGTLDYLSIPAVDIGLHHLERVGMAKIGARVACLTGWLLARLVRLRHSNGRRMIQIYGPEDVTLRGGTVALNCHDPEGAVLDYRKVEELANQQHISLRTGCFCNPGAGEAAEGLTEADIRAAVASDPELNLARFVRFLQSRGDGKSAGAIRVSLGLVSNLSDVERFLQFIAGFRDQARATVGDFDAGTGPTPSVRDGS
jgi:selenocysteine lyase/cysteine desulfurase